MKESTKEDLLLYGILLSLLCVPLLLFAIGDQAHGYYQFLRVTVTTSGIVTAAVAYFYKVHIIVIMSAIVALLFNPVFVITLDKDSWVIIDALTAVYFASASLTFVWKKYTKENEN